MLNLANVTQLWDRIRSSLWFVPGLLALVAVLLAVLAPRIDRLIDSDTARQLPLVFSGRAAGARAVLTTVAGSMITIAGVVFSMTIVSLQLASAQFGPRLLRTFMRDRATQVVLGTFVATFLYSILVLPTVDAAAATAFVPHVAVTLCVVLAVVSLGMLVFFIHHLAQSIRADAVIGAVAEEMHRAIRKHFPQSPTEEPLGSELPAGFGAGGRAVLAQREGYLRFVDFDGLVELAAADDLRVRLEVTPGVYVFQDDVLAMVSAGEGASSGNEDEEAAARKLCECFVMDQHRTALQDVSFAFEQLVEMAVRSLSPGINDPRTAMHCVDRIGSGLAQVVARGAHPRLHRDKEGRPRVLERPQAFAELLGRAVGPIRGQGGGHVQLWLRLIDVLGVVRGRARRGEDIEAIDAEAQRAFEEAMANVPDEHDRRLLAEAFRPFAGGVGRGAGEAAEDGGGG